MSRRGKFLSLRLDSGDTVWLHMRMTGQLLVTPPDYPTQKHTDIFFRLDNAMKLRFNDTRRFGRFWLLHEWENDTCTGIAKLGPEPFDGCLTADLAAGKDRETPQVHQGISFRPERGCGN